MKESWGILGCSGVIRQTHSLTDSLLSAAEGAEDSVAKFTSLVRARD